MQSGQGKQYREFAGDQKGAWANARWNHWWLSEAFRITTVGAYVLVFSDWRQLPLHCASLEIAGFVWRGVIAWDKGPTARGPNKAYFRHQCEFIAWTTHGELGKGLHGCGPYPGCFSIPLLRGDAKTHICEKPIPLLRGLLTCVNKGDLVVDPFAGTGAAGVAAKELGLRYLGFELDGHYANAAANRVKAYKV